MHVSKHPIIDVQRAGPAQPDGVFDINKKQIIESVSNPPDEFIKPN